MPEISDKDFVASKADPMRVRLLVTEIPKSRTDERVWMRVDMMFGRGFAALASGMSTRRLSAAGSARMLLEDLEALIEVFDRVAVEADWSENTRGPQDLQIYDWRIPRLDQEPKERSQRDDDASINNSGQSLIPFDGDRDPRGSRR